MNAETAALEAELAKAKEERDNLQKNVARLSDGIDRNEKDIWRGSRTIEELRAQLTRLQAIADAAERAIGAWRYSSQVNPETVLGTNMSALATALAEKGKT